MGYNLAAASGGSASSVPPGIESRGELCVYFRKPMRQIRTLHTRPLDSRADLFAD